MATIKPKLKRYQKSKSHSGVRTRISGDEVSLGLSGMTLDEVKGVAQQLKIADVDRYDHLNPGQIRMILGNRIRGALRDYPELADEFSSVVTPP